jgi:hypothetical protein
LFRRPGPTKQFPENLNDSSRTSGLRRCRITARTLAGQDRGFDKSAEFLTFLWWKSGSGIRRDPKQSLRRLDRTICNFFRVAACCDAFKRILVVGNGNIGVGKKNPRKCGQRIVEGLTARDGSLALRIDDPTPRAKEPVKVCGAMSLQYGDGGRGNESAPQKFVHLVGYRDPKPRAEPWVRPSVSPVKR